ncbi:MAG: hypothetical protein AAF518_15255, partial [Spirochaetota bacterium]
HKFFRYSSDYIDYNYIPIYDYLFIGNFANIRKKIFRIRGYNLRTEKPFVRKIGVLHKNCYKNLEDYLYPGLQSRFYTDGKVDKKKVHVFERTNHQVVTYERWHYLNSKKKRKLLACKKIR